MACKTEHSCDLCGEVVRQGVRISGLQWNDDHSEGLARVSWGERDLCGPCAAPLRAMFNLRWELPAEPVSVPAWCAEFCRSAGALEAKHDSGMQHCSNCARTTLSPSPWCICCGGAMGPYHGT